MRYQSGSTPYDDNHWATATHRTTLHAKTAPSHIRARRSRRSRNSTVRGYRRRLRAGGDRSREHTPAPFVDQQAEGQEGDLVHRLAQQQAEVLVGAGDLIDEADLLQIFRRHRERDHIADRFVKAVDRGLHRMIEALERSKIRRIQRELQLRGIRYAQRMDDDTSSRH